MHVWVTGGAGFIGSHIVDRLIAENHRVTVVDNLSTGSKENIHRCARFLQLDILDSQLDTIFGDDPPQAVIHQAAQISVSRSMAQPGEDARINIEGTIHLLELCRKFGSHRFLMASSAAVYGNPVGIPIQEDSPLRPFSPYGISKMAGEHYLAAYTMNYGLSTCALRYANVYGPRQIAKGEGGVVSVFYQQILDGTAPLIQGDGRQTRDFVFVGDVARANAAALMSEETGVFNIGTQTETSVQDLLEAMEKACDHPIQAEYGDARPGDIRFSALDCQRARTRLGWTARTTLAEGLKETFRYFSNRTAQEGDPRDQS